jgi:copper transport protein
VRRALAVILASAFVPLALPAAAGAHAVLEASSPGRGAALDSSPRQVSFRFNEPVEIAFGSLRVFDASGARVDSGEARHPGDSPEEVAVGLDSELPDGAYTATYRVISADSHPVKGGLVFYVGDAGAVPAASLDELIGQGDSGDVTAVGFGAVRTLSYMAMALAVGALAFVLAVWRPALLRAADAGAAWPGAADAFARAALRLGYAAVGLGIVCSALGIVFQGATAGGTSFWAALDPQVVEDVLGTRFGTVWGLRLLAWGVVTGLLVVSATRLRAPVLRPASLGAVGVAPAAGARAGVVGALVLALAFVCLTPALGGHPSSTTPSWLLVPANFLHVTAMATWVGGIALLALAVPRATGRLEAPDRSRLLAAVVERFSGLAVVAVALLALSGVVQGIAYLESLSDLLDTAFGRAVLIKVGLFSGLVALGALNRQRLRPRLRAHAEAGRSPGSPGVTLRRSLLSELALMAAVLGVTAALVSYSPPSSLAQGPFSTSRALGPARAELTVDPASLGPNEVHLYLFDRRTGAQFDRVKELRLEAALPSKDIGPIRLPAEKAGPGHYLVRRAGIAPAGDWRLDAYVRVSEFDQYRLRVEVPIE